MGELVKGCVIFQGTDRILPGTFPAMLSIDAKGSRSSSGECHTSRLCPEGVYIMLVKLVSQTKWFNFMFSFSLDYIMVLSMLRVQLNRLYQFLILSKIA